MFNDLTILVSSVLRRVSSRLKQKLNYHSVTATRISVGTRVDRTSFWWHETGRVLSLLLERSAYPEDLRRQYLAFYKAYVIPLLGPSPPEFRNIAATPSSFMSDEFTPIEFSWVVDSESAMTVRFTMEPLSPLDGSPTPADTWMGLLQSLAQVGNIQNFDIAWSQVCYDTLTYAPRLESNTSQHSSQFSVGADFTHRGIVGKAYFLPHIRAQATSRSTAAVVTDCMDQLGLETPWEMVLSYLGTLSEGCRASPEIVAVDCIEASKNRAKVYVRTQASSFRDVADLMTLGGRLSGPSISETLSTLRQLWRLLFDDIGEDECLPSKRPNHYTSGFVVYFEMALGSPTPMPKVYIPVRHYCTDDAKIARAMGQYYKDSGNVTTGERYLADVQSFFTHRDLSSRTGIHTYVGCAARKKGTQVSVYFSPEAFAPER